MSMGQQTCYAPTVKNLAMIALAPALMWAESSVLLSHKTVADVELTADANSPLWRGVEGIVMDSDYFGARVPNHRTEVKSRWTPAHLYLLFICQNEELNLKPEPSTTAETPQLWNWDVVEAFLGADP